MFSSPGLVSLATLWTEFVAKHAENLCTHRRKAYDQGRSWGVFEFVGSPADYVERLFVDSFDRFELSLLSAEGKKNGLLARSTPERRRLSLLNAVETYEVWSDNENDPK